MFPKKQTQRWWLRYRGVFVGAGSLGSILVEEREGSGIKQRENWAVVQAQGLSQPTGKSGPSELPPVREGAFMFQHHGM